MVEEIVVEEMDSKAGKTDRTKKRVLTITDRAND